MTATPAPFDPDEAIGDLRQAARFNQEDPLRQGSILRFPAYGQLVMTGDLHGHRKNLGKLEKYAMLDRVSARHVVLHELVHCDMLPLETDRSHETLLEAARYKCRFPEQVHFLQSNHDLAQLTDYPIAKNGRAVIEEFNSAVRQAYGEQRAGDVLAAMDEFIASFPLAARTANRIWMSHSLPNVYDMPDFDSAVFDRPQSLEDLRTSKTVFNLVWGRRHTQGHIDRLAHMLDVDVFITGHQPQEMGYTLEFGRLIILASDHNHGTFLPFDLSKPHTAEELVRNIRKFVAVT